MTGAIPPSNELLKIEHVGGTQRSPDGQWVACKDSRHGITKPKTMRAEMQHNFECNHYL